MTQNRYNKSYREVGTQRKTDAKTNLYKKQ